MLVDSRCHFCTLVWQLLRLGLAAKANKSEPQKLLQQAAFIEIRARHDTSLIDTLCELEIVCGDIMRKKRQEIVGCAGDRSPGSLVKPSQGLHNWSDSEEKHQRDSIRPMQMFFSTSSDEHMALARYLLEECCSKHVLCNSQGGAASYGPGSSMSAQPAPRMSACIARVSRTKGRDIAH